MKIIFLDNDGVLNRRGKEESPEKPLLEIDCIHRFNKIFAAAGGDTQIVFTTSWRWVVFRGLMRPEGFVWMMKLWGLSGIDYGFTNHDDNTRGTQISNYLRGYLCDKYIVLDDRDDDISIHHPLIKTDGNVGLSDADVDLAVGML